MRYSGGIVIVIECDERSQREMARHRQILGKEIGQILKAWDEDDAKLTLLNPIPQPMKPHIQWLGHFGGDGVVGEANRNLIVTKNGCCWLRMTHVANTPAYSASATKEQTTGMRVEWLEMGWLRNSSSSSWPRKWCDPATLPAFGWERYDASERTRSTIPDAR